MIDGSTTYKEPYIVGKFQKHTDIKVDQENLIDDQIDSCCNDYDCTYMDVVTMVSVENRNNAI